MIFMTGYDNLPFSIPHAAYIHFASQIHTWHPPIHKEAFVLFIVYLHIRVFFALTSSLLVYIRTCPTAKKRHDDVMSL